MGVRLNTHCMLIGVFMEYRGFTGSIEYDYKNYRYCGSLMDSFGQYLDKDDRELYYTSGSEASLHKEFMDVVDNYLDGKKRRFENYKQMLCKIKVK